MRIILKLMQRLKLGIGITEKLDELQTAKIYFFRNQLTQG